MTETVLIERHDRVALARLNRPEALNALNTDVLFELGAKLTELDGDSGVGCIVLTGNEKAFAAGADIKQMRDLTYAEVSASDFLAGWHRIAKIRTPKIAAVSGYALGGGCELAMMCDLIFASTTAQFGQPEIKLGIIPGMGGSQRLTRAIGKAKAMDLVLTGRMMGAEEAERAGLIARIFPPEKLLEETLAVAQTIASFGKPSVLAAKECIDRAFEMTLEEGLLFERRVFHALFATEDQKEGMSAFIEKRKPVFKGR